MLALAQQQALELKLAELLRCNSELQRELKQRDQTHVQELF